MRCFFQEVQTNNKSKIISPELFNLGRDFLLVNLSLLCGTLLMSPLNG